MACGSWQAAGTTFVFAESEFDPGDYDKLTSLGIGLPNHVVLSPAGDIRRWPFTPVNHVGLAEYLAAPSKRLVSPAALRLIQSLGLVPLPLAPTAVAATAVGRDVTLSWSLPDGSSAATGYSVEAGSAPGRNDLATLRVTEPRTVVSGVPPGRYFIRVRAVNVTGNGPPSEDIVVNVR